MLALFSLYAILFHEDVILYLQGNKKCFCLLFFYALFYFLFVNVYMTSMKCITCSLAKLIAIFANWDVAGKGV